MHRIDGPGATVDNTFTEGDPVGGIQATVVTDDWLNDMQEELMSLLSAAGITPVKGAQDQVLKSIRKVSAGVVGQSRNLSCSVSAASTSASFTADELVVGSALGGLRYCLSGFSKTINLATVGVSGMDVGLAPVSGWVAIYAAYNPSNALSATNPMLIGKDATSALQPEVYSGANMPAGYTASALIAVVPTNASRQIPQVRIVDRYHHYFSTIFGGTVASLSTFTPISIAAAVPINAKKFTPNMAMSPTSAINLSASVTPVAAIGSPGYGSLSGYAGTAGIGVFGGQYSVTPILTPQSIFLAANGNGSITYNSYGYEI